ncbi:hypothetical protein A1O1_04931 [Capronia coronata CBS 617.96]|uniref:HRQ family protein 2 n=1 Tax=Capronia coronata CBS 617.96 TaxID=1182541 RepID=W9Z0E8_9EURO|nr:uncharacterized protein A1O1_04931 [Capronia coronata CBS 617.96]EXJ88004.1 hypothetical protein A1O1_04931 [Capronia coronata CBS 617.96]
MKNHLPNIEKPSFMWHLRSLEDIKAASGFTLANYMNIILLVVFVYFAIRQARAKQQAAEKAGYEKRYIRAPEFPPIEEQQDFDWKTTEPIPPPPLKSKYFLTMGRADSDDPGLEKLPPSELLLIDKTYEERIAYRRRIMAEQGKHIVNVNDDLRIRPAVVELYQFLLGTYLPLRFPTMFKLHETEYEQGKAFMLENFITGALFPAKVTAQMSTERLLETLGRTVDEDFLFLLPEEDSDDPKYVLEAYVIACASGFDPAEKIGKRLADIHGPVPGYSDKLESSMDRFFSKVEVGKYVKRSNWSVTTDAELFTPGKGSVHAHEGDDIEEVDHVNLDTTFVRCERQTLHRLPNSKALVFAFHTYLYPIKQIKEDGAGEELALAIDGLRLGNVPQMHFYKRGVVWGEAVKRYLRS